MDYGVQQVIDQLRSSIINSRLYKIKCRPMMGAIFGIMSKLRNG